MFRRDSHWKPVPYDDDDKEFLKEQARERRAFFEEQFAQEERDKVVEWRLSNGKLISLHVTEDKSIYWKMNFSKRGEAHISGLRRPTAAEKAKNPDLHAVIQGEEFDTSGFGKGFVAKLGLNRECYMALRARLEK